MYLKITFLLVSYRPTLQLYREKNKINIKERNPKGFWKLKETKQKVKRIGLSDRHSVYWSFYKLIKINEMCTRGWPSANGAPLSCTVMLCPLAASLPPLTIPRHHWDFSNLTPLYPGSLLLLPLSFII